MPMLTNPQQTQKLLANLQLAHSPQLCGMCTPSDVCSDQRRQLHAHTQEHRQSKRP